MDVSRNQLLYLHIIRTENFDVYGCNPSRADDPLFNYLHQTIFGKRLYSIGLQQITSQGRLVKVTRKYFNNDLLQLT